MRNEVIVTGITCCKHFVFFDVYRFDVFISNVSKLLKGTSPLHQAALTPIQIVFFILLFLVFCYFIAFKSHWTDVVGIKFDPQLRYVIGPPPL